MAITRLGKCLAIIIVPSFFALPVMGQYLELEEEQSGAVISARLTDLAQCDGHCEDANIQEVVTLLDAARKLDPTNYKGLKLLAESLLVLGDLPGEIGVYASGRLVGAGIIESGAAGIAVWGDYPTTSEIDGAVEGESLELRLANGSRLSAEVLQGDLVYRTNVLTVLRLGDVIATPVEFGIVSAYPNPFNSVTRIAYSLSEAGMVDVAVYDLSGRCVLELASGSRDAGMHSVTFDASGMSSGVYLVRLESAGQVSRQKLTLVK